VKIKYDLYTVLNFQVFATMKDAVVAFMRRSLCYPLFRNYDLSVKILKDVQILLLLG